jgi:CheY-like chemotaxis protein
MSQPVVLLVEDAPELGVIVSALGRRGGYAVAHRTDVPTAWDYLRETRPDLVLLDLQLPGESGLELCRRVRATPWLATLPVALFGQPGLSADVVAGLEAGVDYLVSKELVGRPDAFRRRLEEILPGADGRARERVLGWRAGSAAAAPPGDWTRRLRGALRQPALRGLGPEALRCVVARAFGRAFPAAAADLLAAVLPGGETPDRVPPPPRPEVLLGLVASLAEQVWCLLGAEACTPFWAALADVVPGCPEGPRAGLCPGNETQTCR